MKYQDEWNKACEKDLGFIYKFHFITFLISTTALALGVAAFVRTL